MDPNPSNPSFRYNGSIRKGGKELIDELAEAIHQDRVADMARLFLQTCPGEENRGWRSSQIYVLERAAKGLPDEEEAVWVTADLIRFQWEISLLCDHIVSLFGLRVPNGQICLLWDDRRWRFYTAPITKSQLAKYDDTRAYLLYYRSFPYRGRRSQGPPFTRAVHYLAAALAETTQTFDECMAKADEIVAFAKAWEGNFQERVGQNENVVESGQK
ncbi:hypothetical protein J3E69DRAFT_375170 [Trichoderma sp. SZMC 28015]